MSSNVLHVVLGCFGREDDGFVNCTGIQNVILIVEPSLYHYDEIMDYLDQCQMFDRVVLEYNAVRHFIFNLGNKFDQPAQRLFSEKKFRLYQKFAIDHKDCGLFAKLATEKI